MITSNFNNKEPDLIIDLNLLRGDPPASITVLGASVLTHSTGNLQISVTGSSKYRPERSDWQFII